MFGVARRRGAGVRRPPPRAGEPARAAHISCARATSATRCSSSRSGACGSPSTRERRHRGAPRRARTRRGRRRARGDDQRAAYRRTSPRCATARCSSSRVTRSPAWWRSSPTALRGITHAGRAPTRARHCARAAPPARWSRSRSCRSSADPSATGFAARLRDALERLTGAASNVTVGGDGRRARGSSRGRGRPSGVVVRRARARVRGGRVRGRSRADRLDGRVRAAGRPRAARRVGGRGPVGAGGGAARSKRVAARCAARTELVLVHPSHTRDPRGTRALAARPHRRSSSSRARRPRRRRRPRRAAPARARASASCSAAAVRAVSPGSACSRR